MTLKRICNKFAAFLWLNEAEEVERQNNLDAQYRNIGRDIDKMRDALTISNAKWQCRDCGRRDIVNNFTCPRCLSKRVWQPGAGNMPTGKKPILFLPDADLDGSSDHFLRSDLTGHADSKVGTFVGKGDE